MAQGLQVFDGSGRLIVDMSYKILTNQGSVDTNAAAGSTALPVVPAGKTRFYYTVAIADRNQFRGKLPGVTVSGNQMTWSYSHSNWFGQFSVNSRIYYGYF